ncbi:MAG: ester cyclase, partial [Pyrinomonadaceae bacterium]
RVARECLVDEHVRLENAHDLAGVLGTFGDQASYDDEPWDDRRRGHDAVKAYYETLLAAMPDLHIEVVGRHVAADTIILEVIITGTHLGHWRGVPPTGRPLRFPLCGIYTFDEGDRIAGERIYYDRIEVLKQLGLIHDPATTFGRLMTGLTHPLTIARAIARKLSQLPLSADKTHCS